MPTRTTSNFFKQPSTAFLSNALNQRAANTSTSVSTKATTRKTFAGFFSAGITVLTSNRVDRKKHSGKRIRNSKRGDEWLSERILGSIASVGYLFAGKRKPITILPSCNSHSRGQRSAPQEFWDRLLVQEGMRLPARPHYGPDRGQLVWRKPATATVYGMLHNPIYAGAYSYGRQQIDPRGKVPGRPSTGRRCQSMEDWHVLLRGKLPAYISWDQFLANRKRLKKNVSRFATPGAPREGASLLGGLAVCGRCDCRLYVVYDGRPGTARYQCHNSEPADSCTSPSVAAEPVDALVAEQVLSALEPAALELSLQVEQDGRREQERATDHWHQVLERSHYETQRAYRQYDIVEPENRLVARELESRWEEALREEQKLKEEYARLQSINEVGLQARDP